MNMRIIAARTGRTVVAGALAAGLLAACGGGPAPVAAADPPPPPPPPGLITYQLPNYMVSLSWCEATTRIHVVVVNNAGTPPMQDIEPNAPSCRTAP